MNGASVDSNEQELHPVWIFFICSFPHISRAITIILPVNAKIGWLINANRLISSTIQPEVGSGMARSGTHKRSAHLCTQLMISWLLLTNDLSWLACCWYLTDRTWHFRYRYWSFFLRVCVPYNLLILPANGRQGPVAWLTKSLVQCWPTGGQKYWPNERHQHFIPGKIIINRKYNVAIWKYTRGASENSKNNRGP